MLRSTAGIYAEYDAETKKRVAETAKKTVEQIRREYLTVVFTYACRRRLDIWSFAQAFMESRFAFALDKPETMFALEKDEIFRDFMIECANNGTEIESLQEGGIAQSRGISQEAAWLVEIYNRWHSKTGEASCEIAERAPASLLKKIHKKAMTHEPGRIIELLIEHSAAEAAVTSKDYDELERAYPGK
ncbi:MAG: hypothetical protein K6E42_09425 [Synergistes sp.]|nr:hypothetical protein [Synergistes sp.]